ncbi:MAG: OmpA family protein [Flavobacteriaceae bacterium]
MKGYNKKQRVLGKLLWIALLFLCFKSFGQVPSDQFANSKSLNIEQSNTWSIGLGFSNFIMHGDLRSIGTGSQGNFWNYGGYVYADKMFNSIVGLEVKLNYNKISGGAQYFSDIYDILYVPGTTINDNLFFEGTSIGGELNAILSFSNFFRKNDRKLNLAGYFGIGYHLYDSRLFERNANGTTNLLIDFGSNPSRNSQNKTSSIFFSAQLGLKYRLSRKIDLEFRTGWYFNYEDHLDATISDKQIWETFFVNQIGLSFKLGKKNNHVLWKPETLNNSENTFKIVDTDGDGVMNQLDIQPNTPKGVKVYGNGEAVDADKDGVPDYKDECPLQPGTLENKGCPLLQDSDNDGLMDNKDLCPLQPGPKENKGCPKFKDNDKVTIIKYISELAANLYFDTGKFFLNEESKKVLNQIATYMLALPDVNFKIEGHTDNRDLDTRNLYLSQKRADMVFKYLMRKKIKRSRLSAKGYGETRPAYSNDTPQGRQLNRRVEIRPTNELEIDPLKTEVIEQENQSKFYIVKKGDTAYSIAKRYGFSTEELIKLNNLSSTTIKVGQKIKVRK